WHLEDTNGNDWHADAVALAVPAARLPAMVADSLPSVAAPARGIPGASSAVVALAVAPGMALPDRSGVLVATGEPLRAKAMTLTSRKWGRPENVELLRLSF